MNKKPLKSSSKTVYGLEVPSEFKVITNSFSIRSQKFGRLGFENASYLTRSLISLIIQV